MKEIEATTHEFKTHFSAFLRRLQAGEAQRVIVKNRGEPVGAFSLYEEQKPVRRLGGMEGEIEIDWDQWNALDKEIEDEIYRNLDGYLEPEENESSS